VKRLDEKGLRGMRRGTLVLGDSGAFRLFGSRNAVALETAVSGIVDARTGVRKGSLDETSRQ